ncbi:MAG: hypothetical protein OQK78_04165 [Gammaproteobacteria bacterium]|nr:hypothetical protein [Gammaproteobacteria bacterium]
MDKRIEQLVERIKELDEELRTLLFEQQNRIFKATESGRIEFEKAVKDTHRHLKVGLFRWLRESQLRNVLSAPFIYGFIVPVIIFDLGVSIYQAICFRLYGIERVVRSDYIVMDRNRLAYLNIIEKVNCIYCEYVNGLIAYAREIGSRTEQYWCPIKHAHKMIDCHQRYAEFLDYGDAENYQKRADMLRRELTKN